MDTKQNDTEIERCGFSLKEIMGLEKRLSEYYDRIEIPFLSDDADVRRHVAEFAEEQVAVCTRHSVEQSVQPIPDRSPFAASPKLHLVGVALWQ